MEAALKDYYLYVKLPKDSINETTLENSAIDPRTYYYLKLFSDFKNSLKNKIKWNWFAAFFGMQWLAYRKMYYFAILFNVFFILISFATEILLGSVFKNISHKALSNISSIIIYIISFFIMGFYGNRLYFNAITAKIKKNIPPAKSNVSIFAIFIISILSAILNTCTILILFYFMK